MNLRELREWPTEIDDLATATRDAATDHTVAPSATAGRSRVNGPRPTKIMNVLSRIGNSQYASSDAPTSAANGTSTWSIRMPARTSAS